MNQISERQIAEAVEKECRKDLDELVRCTGIPREGWVSMAMLIVDRTGEEQWERHKEWLRDRVKAGTQFAEDVDSLCTAARARGFAEMTKCLEPLADSLRKSSDSNRQILSKNRRNYRSQTLTILLDSILSRKKEFNCWQALSRVIAEACNAAGREAEAQQITADMLLKTAKRYCEGVEA